jgi:hypothetical protein
MALVDVLPMMAISLQASECLLVAGTGGAVF